MKTFFSTLAGLIIVCILAAVIIGFVFWSRVPDMLSNNLSKKLGVAVQVDDVHLNWGKIIIDKVQISNPPRSILSTAFACQEIDVCAPFNRYLNKRIVIDEIDLKNIYLGLEFDSASDTTGNWTRIMSNLQKNTSSSSGKTQQAPPTGSERSVLIHRLVLTNIQVDVVYRKEGGKVKKLPLIPRIELTEISSEGGFPMDQIMNSVLGQMLKEVFIKQNLKNMMQELLNNPNLPYQQYLSPFRGLFSEVTE